MWWELLQLAWRIGSVCGRLRDPGLRNSLPAQQKSTGTDRRVRIESDPQSIRTSEYRIRNGGTTELPELRRRANIFQLHHKNTS